MYFEGRELKEYAEPVRREDLKIGQVYFSVQFADESMFIPIVEPWVYLGTKNDVNCLWFQDYPSHCEGLTWETATDEDRWHFQTAHGEINHMFEYDRALDVLMHCSLKRRRS